LAEYEKAAVESEKLTQKSLENIHNLFSSGHFQFFFNQEEIDSSTCERNPAQDYNIRYWLPLLYGYLGVVMDGELEVRTR
jgi:hypothetical protein